MRTSHHCDPEPVHGLRQEPITRSVLLVLLGLCTTAFPRFVLKIDRFLMTFAGAKDAHY